MNPLRPLAVAAAVALAATLAACAGETEHVCVSWVDFESPAEAAGDADLVVTADVVGTEGTARMFAVDATVHRVEVHRVLKGEFDGDELLVTSTPVTCSGDDIYPDGDPLDTDEQVQLFLERDDGVWRTITPMDGVVPIPADGSLPWDGSQPHD